MTISLINSLESSVKVWRGWVKTSALVYKGAQMSCGRFATYLGISAYRGVCTSSSRYLGKNRYTEVVHAFGSLILPTPRCMMWTISAPFPWCDLVPLCLLVETVYFSLLPRGCPVSYFWFPDNLPWVSMEAYGYLAACWLLHQGVRGMDYKKQSSRDNEEKPNANAHCSGCCGNYREVLWLFFFKTLL